MSPTTLSWIKTDVAEGIATVTIARGELLNSINPAVVHQLYQAFQEVAQDDEVKGIVIAGEGKAFVVGADLVFSLRNIECDEVWRIVKFTEAGHHLFHTIDHCPKPVVARLNGLTLGAGAELALVCDWVVASPRASFGFPEAGIGIFPALGGTQRLPRAIGIGLAKWLIFTGKTLSATDAQKLGLVNLVVPHEELEATARQMALRRPAGKESNPVPAEFAKIERFFASHRVEELRQGTAQTDGDPVLERAMRQVANKAPLSLRIAEKLIDEGSRRTLAEGLQMEVDHVMEIYHTQDAYRGLTSRVRRNIGQPAFVGR